MRILAIGNNSQLVELKSKFGDLHTYQLVETGKEAKKHLMNTDIVFDFSPSADDMIMYSEFKNPVFINSVFSSLSVFISHFNNDQTDLIFGFYGLPTLINRSVLEVTVGSKKNEDRLKHICSQLETDFVCVEDRVGGVTARVICMIINEAYYTLEEGIANRADIDMAMKLGTNYPYGPFEWAQRIGIGYLIKLLDALYQDTHDDRYKVCDLLRSDLRI